MAKLKKLSDTSWLQPFKDRKKEIHLWPSHSEVASYCGFEDGTKRLLKIQFEKHQDCDVIDFFQITSGREVSFPKEYREFIKSVVLENPNSFFTVEVMDILDGESQSLSSTTGLATIKTRLVQSKFRKDLIRYWKRCCSVTQFPLVELLVASHIKPWAKSDEEERRDVYNGFLLTPTLDKLFDQGFITFSNDGAIMISTRVKDHRAALGIDKNQRVSLDDKHRVYLDYHREKIFQK